MQKQEQKKKQSGCWSSSERRNAAMLKKMSIRLTDVTPVTIVIINSDSDKTMFDEWW
jgi:hypothetical protein